MCKLLSRRPSFITRVKKLLCAGYLLVKITYGYQVDSKSILHRCNIMHRNYTTPRRILWGSLIVMTRVWFRSWHYGVGSLGSWKSHFRDDLEVYSILWVMLVYSFYPIPIWDSSWKHKLRSFRSSPWFWGLWISVKLAWFGRESKNAAPLTERNRELDELYDIQELFEDADSVDGRTPAPWPRESDWFCYVRLVKHGTRYLPSCVVFPPPAVLHPVRVWFEAAGSASLPISPPIR